MKMPGSLSTNVEVLGEPTLRTPSELTGSEEALEDWLGELGNSRPFQKAN